MKQGKYTRKAPVRGRRTKPTLLLACIALILCLSIGGTLAYIVANSGTVSNEFVPGQVSCEVIRSGNTISVKNTSNIPAYLRATYAVNWVENGNIVYKADATSANTSSEWQQGENGIYYYQDDVASGASVVFITGHTSGATVEVVAEAIQAEGMGASNAQDAWTKAQAGS